MFKEVFHYKKTTFNKDFFFRIVSTSLDKHLIIWDTTTGHPIVSKKKSLLYRELSFYIS